MSVRVGVLDYGAGNLHSACRALVAAGVDVVVSGDPTKLQRCDALVVPGVGAFAACLRAVRDVGADELIERWVAAERPLLGICVGHQLLFEAGTEHGVETAGLGVLPGRVEELRTKRRPHMGWNDVVVPRESRMFEGVENERFYFVHSYAARPESLAGVSVAVTDHDGDSFVSAVEHGPVWSTQFHPEKSGPAGARVLRNWLAAWYPDWLGSRS